MSLRKFCSHAGCYNVKPCSVHTTTAHEMQRPNAAKRGYTNARWRRLRLLVLARDPICMWPECDKPATEVDHIKAKRHGGDAWDESNLQGLCKRHHSTKTRSGE